ncbi:MAG: hypothetical protein IJ511_01215 [Bacteroides sp.]|nr:hypothetical protein [Bacteroides sp.]
MKETGGYFSLELSHIDNMPHSDGILLNTGRNAIEYILRSILPDISKLHIPYFTCDTVLEPLEKLHVPYDFYPINEKLELSVDIELEKGEYLLYTNYYGIKDAYVHELDRRYSNQLIVDNAQALYCPATGKSAYSPRKYVGIPDGGIAFTDKNVTETFDRDCSYDRCSHLLKRADLNAGEGYADFRTNSVKLKNQPIRQMSKLTKALINSIDFEAVKEKRRKNFQILHEALEKSNGLPIPDMVSFACPLIYPYLTDDSTLKKRLIDNKIFVATYWPNVLEWCKEDTLEFRLADRVIAIPVDQRYGEEEMKYIIEKII